jgi:hypothetical protein
MLLDPLVDPLLRSASLGSTESSSPGAALSAELLVRLTERRAATSRDSLGPDTVAAAVAAKAPDSYCLALAGAVHMRMLPTATVQYISRVDAASLSARGRPSA